MKFLLISLFGLISIGFTSCLAKKGCPSSGKNVGAERVLSGDSKTMKSIKRAPKFKS